MTKGAGNDPIYAGFVGLLVGAAVACAAWYYGVSVL